MTEVAAGYKVFVSYSQADRAWAEEFAQRLKERSIEVWAADEEFGNGSGASESLVRGLKESDVVVILFDSKTLQNPNALFELGAAMMGNKAVVPVVPREMKVSHLPIPLERLVFLAKSSPEVTAATLIEQLSHWLPSEFDASSQGTR